MEEYTQITLDQWMQWKEDIRRKLGETAENFVYIGYRLKQIRDSGIYAGAADIFEFAKNEYGLGKSTVSRFIAINEKYSVDGNSLELKEEYKGFSSSKLAEMLTLPDNELQLVTEHTTVSEIRELKRFVREEQELAEARNSEESVVTEEITAEAEKTQEGGTEAPQTAAESGCVQVDAETQEERNAEWQGWGCLEKCIIHFFSTRKDVLNAVIARLDEENYKAAAEAMNPSGQSSHRRGIVFLFMYAWDVGVKYKLMTKPDTESLTWQQFLDIIKAIFGCAKREDVWSDFYPKTAENQGVSAPVATSQQTEKTEEKETQKPQEPQEKKEEPEQEKAAETKAEDAEDTGEHVESVDEAVEASEAAAEEEQADTVCTEETEVAAGRTETDMAAVRAEPVTVISYMEANDSLITVTRKEFMDNMDIQGLALYLCVEYEDGKLKTEYFEEPSKLEKWLTEKVDADGEPAEEIASGGTD